MVGKIIDSVEGGAKAPRRGHPVHEYPEEPLREVHASPYRVIYSLSDTELRVVTIVHSKQQLDRKWLSR